MKQFENDELDELPVASSKPATTTATTATTRAATTAPVKDELEDDGEVVPAAKSHAKEHQLKEHQLKEHQRVQVK